MGLDQSGVFVRLVFESPAGEQDLREIPGCAGGALQQLVHVTSRGDGAAREA
jgi:hypothetical protein